MAFEVLAPVPALTGFTVEAGVESSVLRWDASAYPVEIWRGSTNSFGAATHIATTGEQTFTDTPLPAGVVVWHFARPVRTVSTGDQFHGAVSSGSSTPARAELGTAQVQTINIAIDAVTSQAVYEETSYEWVRYGTDENNVLVDGMDAVWVLPDITFNGTGDSMVITAICRQVETPIIFRMGNSMVYCGVEAAIKDVTDPPNPVILQQAPITVAGYRNDLMTISGVPSYISTGTTRDYYNNFLLDTEVGHTYAISFILFCGASDESNYILWNSDLRQVFWNVYKR
jgi:hypothetical protein